MRKAHLEIFNGKTLLPEAEGLYRDSLVMASAPKTELENARLQLLEALGSEDQDMVRRVLMQHSDLDISSQDDMGRTALHILCQKVHQNNSQITTTFGPEPNGFDNRSVIEATIYSQKCSMIDHLLLELAINPNVPDEKGWYPLHYAAYNGNAKAVQSLLAAGANPNQDTSSHQYPIHYASRNGHLHVVKLLLNANANPNPSKPHSLTPLIHAVKNKDAQMVKLLLASNVDPKKTGRYQNAMSSLQYAAKNGDVQILAMLLEANANIDYMSYYGMTALIVASREGHVQAVEFLLERTANFEISFQTAGRLSALKNAAMKGHSKIAQLLLDAGANPNASDGYGMTALHYAAERGDSETIKLLLRSGAKLLAIALANDCQYTAMTPLQVAIVCGNYVAVKLLWNESVNPNRRNSCGMALLHLAAQGGDSQIIELLMQSGADLLAISSPTAYMRKARNYRYVSPAMTPLQIAIVCGNYAAVRFLLVAVKNVDVNLKNIDGMALLHLAAKNGNSKIIELLLQFGADAFAFSDADAFIWTWSMRYQSGLKRYFSSMTPLQIAITCGNHTAVKLLLAATEKDMNPNSYNLNGLTLLHLAAQNGNCEIIELLLSFGADPFAISDAEAFA